MFIFCFLSLVVKVLFLFDDFGCINRVLVEDNLYFSLLKLLFLFVLNDSLLLGNKVISVFVSFFVCVMLYMLCEVKLVCLKSFVNVLLLCILYVCYEDFFLLENMLVDGVI